MLCFKVKLSIKFTSLIRLFNSATSSSKGVKICEEVKIREMTRQTRVAKLPPFVVVEPLPYEVVSSYAEDANVNLGEGACLVD